MRIMCTWIMKKNIEGDDWLGITYHVRANFTSWACFKIRKESESSPIYSPKLHNFPYQIGRIILFYYIVYFKKWEGRNCKLSAKDFTYCILLLNKRAWRLRTLVKEADTQLHTSSLIVIKMFWMIKNNYKGLKMKH